MRDFKKYTSREIVRLVLETSGESRSEWMLRLFKYYGKYNKNNSKFQFWRPDNHPVELVSKKWLGEKIDYVHNNPVTAGVVLRPEDYIYRSASAYSCGTSIIEIQTLDLW